VVEAEEAGGIAAKAEIARRRRGRKRRDYDRELR
jgi:hypothetical protein